jgi:hypothetical protein
MASLSFFFCFFVFRLGASMMEKAMIDINPDEAIEMSKKKKLMRWDAKKGKFVKQTLSEMAEAKKSGLKRMRSESGVTMKLSTKQQVRKETIASIPFPTFSNFFSFSFQFTSFSRENSIQNGKRNAKWKLIPPILKTILTTVICR